MRKKNTTLKKRLNVLLGVCLIPLAVLVIYLLIMMNRFSNRYDLIVENITKANAYNIDFKENMDYVMYIIVVNSERAAELVDTEQPHVMINEAREVFENLYEEADRDYAKKSLNRILKSLNTLEDRVEEIEADALVSGAYDTNMERLDLNIRVLTELIQEQIQKYIYYETTNLEELREGIRRDVDMAIRMSIVVFAAILTGTLLINRKIVSEITEPISKLCEVTTQAGEGNFVVRAEETGTEELTVLTRGFNQIHIRSISMLCFLYLISVLLIF